MNISTYWANAKKGIEGFIVFGAGIGLTYFIANYSTIAKESIGTLVSTVVNHYLGGLTVAGLLTIVVDAVKVKLATPTTSKPA